MKSQITIRCEPGDRVRILTSNKVEDPNTYTVQKKDRHLLHLLCESTQKAVRVHESRVVTNLDKESTVSTENESTTPSTDTPATAAKPKAAKKTAVKVEKVKAKAKPKRVRVDFSALLESAGEGSERFSKKVEFDHEAMEVRANVVIAGDHRSFVTFNTYDGSLGRKSGDTPTYADVGSKYDLADDAAYDKKVARLKADGYTGPYRSNHKD